MKPKQGSNRAVAIALSIAAAAALLFAMFSHRWLDFPSEGDYGFGLLSFRACNDDGCETRSNFEVVQARNDRIDAREAEELKYAPDQRVAKERRPSAAFAPLGVVAFAALVPAVLGLLAAAALAIAKKRPELPMMPTTLALLGVITGIVAGCTWIALKPEIARSLAAGWAFWAFGAGSVLGLAAALMINRHIRPIDEDPGPPPSESMAWT